MENYELAFSIILVSAGIGLFAATLEPFESADKNHNTESHDTGSERVHAHAMIHVIVNGSELDFTADRFQLNARDVHLENNKSHIVHKHRSGVTWQRFFNTINTTYWRSNATGNLCLDIYNSERCGDGAVYLNGEKVENLTQEITQNDHVVIVLDTDNREQVLEEYFKKQLPQAYKPQESRGKRV